MAKYEKVHNGLGVKTLSHLILKEIYHRYGTKNLTNEQTKKCKIFERGISEKYDNFSENELNTFIRINTGKEGFDANYDIVRIQTFISKFKNRQLNKLEKQWNKKNGRTRNPNKKN